MSQEIINTEFEEIAQDLYLNYGEFMLLKIFIDSDDMALHDLYREAVEKHNNKIMNDSEMVDAGFDLFTPKQSDTEENILCYCHPIKVMNESQSALTTKIDFKVICSAQMIIDIDITEQEEFLYHTGYDMRPRSSLSGTKLRLANSVGTIDAGYRGHLMGKFDLVNVINMTDEPIVGYTVKKYERLVQICAPGLLPILVKIVDTKEELGDTARGEGGFGSTGK